MQILSNLTVFGLICVNNRLIGEVVQYPPGLFYIYHPNSVCASCIMFDLPGGCQSNLSRANCILIAHPPQIFHNYSNMVVKHRDGMVCYWQIAPVYICQSVLVSPTLFSHCCFTLSLCVNGEYFSATVHGFIKADGHSDAWMHFSLGPLYNNLAQCILKSTYLCVLQSSAPRR